MEMKLNLIEYICGKEIAPSSCTFGTDILVYGEQTFNLQKINGAFGSESIGN